MDVLIIKLVGWSKTVVKGQV